MSTERIAKLFSYADDAESRGQSQEAQSFFAKAAQLCESMGVSEAKVRADMDKGARKDAMTVLDIRIGVPGSRGLRVTASSIAQILSSMFQARIDLRNDGSKIFFYGTGEQAERAKLTVESIITQMESARNVAHKEYSSQVKQGLLGPYPERFSRVSFYQGFLDEMLTLARNISSKRSAFINKNVPDDDVAESEYTKSNSTALALRELDLEVRDFYKDKSTARGSFKSGTAGYNSTSSHRMGVEAGQSVSLSSQKALA